MALFKIALFLTFVCLAQCSSVRHIAVNDWNKLLSETVYIAVADGNRNPMVNVNLTLSVCGNYNNTTYDRHVASQFVQEKLSSLQYLPDQTEISENIKNGNNLPLLLSVELSANINVTVPAKKDTLLLLDVDVYAKKKNQRLAMEVAQNAMSSFKSI